MSFGELSPRLFSFNSPYGACKDCRGLGAKLDFNLDLIVPDKRLTIREGTLVPLGKLRGEWGKSQLEALGERYDFDLDVPFEKINEQGEEFTPPPTPQPEEGL